MQSFCFLFSYFFGKIQAKYQNYVTHRYDCGVNSQPFLDSHDLAIFQNHCEMFLSSYTKVSNTRLEC